MLFKEQMDRYARHFCVSRSGECCWNVLNAPGCGSCDSLVGPREASWAHLNVISEDHKASAPKSVSKDDLFIVRVA